MNIQKNLVEKIISVLDACVTPRVHAFMVASEMAKKFAEVTSDQSCVSPFSVIYFYFYGFEGIAVPM